MTLCLNQYQRVHAIFIMQLLGCSEVDGQKIWMFSCHGYLEYHLVVEGLVKLLLVKVLLMHSWYLCLITFFFASGDFP
jgi:hypothetical protein